MDKPPARCWNTWDFGPQSKRDTGTNQALSIASLEQISLIQPNEQDHLDHFLMTHLHAKVVGLMFRRAK